MKINTFAAAGAALVTTAVGHSSPVEPASRAEKPAIVLVHGAYADGSSWNKVIPLLQASGYHVVSVQNPTTSLADDVTATQRVLDQLTGPVVLVGHSWAGVVITQAGNHPKVKALVYVDASAPDSGQSILDAGAGGPAEPGASAGVKDENGFLLLPEAAVRNYFCQDLPAVEQGIVFAVQTPWAIGCLTDKVTHAAWRDKPSWWIYGEFDHMISPKLQERMAATIKAQVTKVATGHLAMLADPKAVYKVILAAADQVQSQSQIASSAPAAGGISARLEKRPAGVVPLGVEPAARIIIDPPLADPLAKGRVVIRYQTENLRIEPVFGPAALDVSPRIGHLHVTVDDAPWHWLDASGEPLTITGLSVGPHKVLIELVNSAHQTLDFGVLTFDVPVRSLVPPDPSAAGFRSAPKLADLGGLRPAQAKASRPAAIASH